MYNREKCFICFSIDATWIKESTYDGLEYSCPRCGKYTITKDAYEFLEKQDNHAIRNEFDKKAPSLAAEMKLKGETPFAIELSLTGRLIVNGRDFLNTYPEDFEEKIWRSLNNLYRLLKPMQWESIIKDDVRYFFSNNLNEAASVVLALKKLNYIKKKDESLAVFDFSIMLTLDGWRAAKKYNAKIINKNTVFVAMWFDVNATSNYRTATKKAIIRAGYEPVIVDEVMHNDFIMDKITNLINESRFVIADFSCAPETIDKEKIKNGVRGGVYYEAGYAKGLGLQVIHTCNKSSFDQNRLHFDIQQKSTIIWHDNNGIIKTNGYDYIEYLKEHIIATVGKGQKMNNALILQGTLINAGKKASKDELLDFLSENLNDVDFYQYKLRPGEITAVSLDWKMIINTTVAILGIANYLWSAYEKFIKPIREKNVDSSAGLLINIKEANGKIYQITLGKECNAKEIFIAEFQEKVTVLLKSSNKNLEELTQEITQSERWVKVEKKRKKKP